MVFSSAVFLLAFLPIVLSVYYMIPVRLKNPMLLLASLIFYAWGEPVYVLIMLFSTVFDYGNGLMLEHLDRTGQPHRRKWVLALSVAVNLGLLGFFKYTDFLLGSLNALFGTGFVPLRLPLPIGISFYTFQTLSYTIDVYRREIPSQRGLVDFGMYVCLFPQLIAGPIVRYRDIASQIGVREIGADKACAGIFRFVQGLAKKVLLANCFGALWDEISAQDGERAALTAFLGAAAYMLQIYFDFSGYSDMAIGIGLAYLARHMVPRIPLHTARRQPPGFCAADTQSADRLAAHGTVARRGLAVCRVGTVFLRAAGAGKALSAAPAGAASRRGFPYLYAAGGASVVGDLCL